MRLHRLVLTNYRGITHREIEFPDHGVVVVSGAQQAIDLVARLLVDPGDTVAMEQPGYFGASLAFAAATPARRRSGRVAPEARRSGAM